MVKRSKRNDKIPYISFAVLAVIIVGCMFSRLLPLKDPAYLDLANFSHAPCKEFLFGTDNLGRDLFSCIWNGGRISIFIGLLSTVISTVIAVIYGTLSGIASDMVDTLLMRFAEILLSVPSLLIIVFVQAIIGQRSPVTISIVIGITSWCSIAKIVRTEVRQLRKSEYVIASRCMGGSFLHVLYKHLAPNFISSIMFMVIMNIRSAIVAESTLSFMGLGLPIETISWGSMLSLSENALMSRAWWMILIPGLFLVILLLCLTEVGNYLRRSVSHRESNI